MNADTNSTARLIYRPLVYHQAAFVCTAPSYHEDDDKKDKLVCRLEGAGVLVHRADRLFDDPHFVAPPRGVSRFTLSVAFLLGATPQR